MFVLSCVCHFLLLFSEQKVCHFLKLALKQSGLHIRLGLIVVLAGFSCCHLFLDCWLPQNKLSFNEYTAIYVVIFAQCK